MRRLRWMAVVGTVLGLHQSVDASVLVNFDTLPGGGAIASGTPATNQYAVLGVTFTGFEDGVEIAPEIRSQQFISVPASPPNYLTNFFNFPSTGDADRLDEIRISFSSGASNIEFDLNTAGTNTITFDLYDTGGAFLQTVTRDGNGTNNVHVTLPGTGIGRISAFQPQDNWWWSLDNLQFDAAPQAVPEPSTIALGGIAALAGLLVGIKRRRRGQ